MAHKEIVRFDDSLRSIASVDINPRSRTVSITHKGLYPKQEVDAHIIRRPQNSTYFQSVMWSGGSGIIVNTGDSDKLLAVWRDSKAWSYPNKLDTFSGMGCTVDPILTSILEAFEEVIITKNGRPLVAKFEDSSLKMYEGVVKSTVEELSGKFGISGSSQPILVKMAQYEDPYYLKGMPVVLGFFNFDDGMARVIAVNLPPFIYNIDDCKQQDIIYRETLGLETRGKVPERKVVEINLKDGKTNVYNKGALDSEFSSLQNFVENSGIDSKNPFSDTIWEMVSHLKGYPVAESVRKMKLELASKNSARQ